MVDHEVVKLRFLQKLGRASLQLRGWTLERDLPPEDRYVVVGAPHTSNWDFPIAIAGLLGLGIRPRWVGKKALFYGPMGPVMRLLGGVPVDRTHGHGLLRGLVERFEQAERKNRPFVFGITPEGTRSHTDHWKPGFYFLARRAEVPIALGYIDYSSKTAGIGEWFEPSGDREADMQRIRAFYEDKTALHPECHGPVRLQS